MITKGTWTYICILALLFTGALPSMSQIFKPTPAVYPSGGVSAQSVAVADVNRDGKPDIIVANLGINSIGSVGVMLGNGDGTFQAAVTYDVGSRAADSVAVADLNGDGWPDLVVGTADGVCFDRCIFVLLNNGDGTFKAPTSYAAVGFDVISVAVVDVNGDGNPDVVFANECSSGGVCNNSSIGVLLGNGDGTFLPAVTYSLSAATALSVVAADLNHDGKPDLLVAGSQPTTGNGTITVLLNKGDGTFPSQVTYQTGGFDAVSIVVGDVNGDGKLDAVVANYIAAGANPGGSVGVLLGKGDGTFGPAVVYPAGPSTSSVAMGDFNGDGMPDLVVTNGIELPNQYIHGTAQVLLNNGDGTFKTPAIIYSSGGSNAFSVAVGNLNQDVKPDLVIADQCNYHGGCAAGGAVAVLLGVPAKTTATVTTSGTPSTLGQPVTFTAKIIAADGPIPNGTTITFYNNGAEIGTGTATNGAAQFTTSALTAGTHTIKATYPKSAFFKASSGTITQVVN